MSTKKEFLETINKIITSISLEDSKKIIYELVSKIDPSDYEMTLCIIDHIIGKQEKEDDLLKELSIIKDAFTKIENGDICIRCYEENSYDYSPFGEDYYFYPSNELNNILNNSYELGKRLVYHKKYDKAIEIFDLILYTNYQCEEVGNPEYTDYDEVLDTFESDLFNIRNSLDFDLDKVYLYAIYSVLIGQYTNKCERIYNYLKDCVYLTIQDAIDLGIEKINNIDVFYEEFRNYLKDKNDDKSMKILESMY